MPALAHRDDKYETPKWLMDDLKDWTKLTFLLDASASAKNTKCPNYMDEKLNALTNDWILSNSMTMLRKVSVFNNPPRSKNGKFVRKAVEQWKKHNINIVQLLCWNDLGNKYGQECLYPYILSGQFKVKNYGKIIFDKNGKPSKHPSRLNYMAVWMQSTGPILGDGPKLGVHRENPDFVRPSITWN